MKRRRGDEFSSLALTAILLLLTSSTSTKSQSTTTTDELVEIDRSFELFKYSSELKQRTWFKLKCEFTVPSSSLNNRDNQTAYYKIRWFKLNDRRNLTVLNEFETIQQQQLKSSTTVSENVFVSDLETREISIESASSRLSKLRSNLLFVFKNVNDLNRANGLYLCKPDFMRRSSAQAANLPHSVHLSHLQSVQRININGIIKYLFAQNKLNRFMGFYSSSVSGSPFSII